MIPRSRGGAHDPTNMQALHGHCHDEKTAEDGSQSKKRQSGVLDKDRVTEEPDEPNGSRPVLKTSRSREGAA
jgi:RNA-directed DNA polymerase